MENKAPKTVGRYEIKERIGSGASGHVYKAYDPILKRMVSIKLPASDLEDRALDELLSDFYHAAEVGAKFHHANIVTVYDVGRNTPGSSLDEIDYKSNYLVMEYVPGVNLKEYIDQRSHLSVEESLKIIFECCKALDFIHFNGISHRDIKPGNIIIDPQTMTVKLTDFSISDTTYNDLNKHIGTLPYMTPEHFIAGERLTKLTDIFALGAVMYHLLTGVCPFRGGSVDEVVSKIISSHPEPIRNLNPEVSAQVEFIVIKAMSKSPRDRFQSALEFTQAVSMALQSYSQNHAGHEDLEDEGTTIEEYLLLRQHSWFRDFSPSQVEELVRSGEVAYFDPDEYIVTEGEDALSFYTILEGEADVIKDAKVVNHLETGECFGELGHLTQDRKRTASIRATKPVRVLSVDSTSLSNLSAESQASFYKAFLMVTMERLVKSNRNTA